MIKKIMAISLIALALTSCNDANRQQQKQAIDAALPAGCKFQDLGKYRGMNVVAVTCVSHDTTSTSTRWRVGKTNHYAANVVIGG